MLFKKKVADAEMLIVRINTTSNILFDATFLKRLLRGDVGTGVGGELLGGVGILGVFGSVSQLFQNP